MKKIIYFLFLYFTLTFCLEAGEKPASFITVVRSSSLFLDSEARNFAYMNNLKIVGSKVSKQGDNWVKIIKVVPKD
jgi:hypothetical protein